jgi:hypothetical protein
MQLTLHGWIGAIAGICSLLGCIPYWRAILQGKTRPNRATWWIWLVVGIMIMLSYRAAGASTTLWVPITYVVAPFVTSLLAIKFGEGGWTKFDRMCLLGSLASLGFWSVNKSADLTLTINIGIDFLGALPTIRKSLIDPDSENLLGWSIFTIANALNLLAVDRWSNWQVIIYPLYMFLLCGLICWLLWQGRRKTRKSI